MDNIRPIRTEEDYDWALGEVEPYFDNEPDLGTPESDRFNVLVDLIQAYEATTWPIDAPDPIDAICYVIEMRGLKQSDFADVIGSRSRASEVLGRKRRLNLAMIQKINAAWGIPAETLIQPYHLHEAGNG